MVGNRAGTRGRQLALLAVMGLAASQALAFSEPAEELKYMSAQCASLLEAQRTAPSEMRYKPAYAELQRAFNRQCADNQADARRRLYEDKRQAERLKSEKRVDDMRQQLASENEVQLHAAQCREMKVALDTRKKRSNPSEGELRDLQRFEARFDERCR